MNNILQPFSKRVLQFSLAFLLFIFLFCVYYNYAFKLPIRYWDEELWLASTYFFELFIRGDFSNELWKMDQSLNQPKLQDYLYALPIYPNYLQKKQSNTNQEYNMRFFLAENNFDPINDETVMAFKHEGTNIISWGNDDEDNTIKSDRFIEKYGHNIQKTIDIIFAARSINIILLSINLFISFCIAYLLFNNFMRALVASFIYGSNDLLISLGLLANAEGTFVTLFNALVLMMLIQMNSKKTHPIMYAFIGILLGLLNSTKLNGVMLIMTFNVLFLTKLFILKNIKKTTKWRFDTNIY